MGSDLDSSTSSDDPIHESPNSTSIDQSLDAIEDQLASIALTQPNGVAADDESSEQEVFKDAPNGLPLDEDSNQQESKGGEIGEEGFGNSVPEPSSVEFEVVEEVRESSSSGVFAWRRTNSELEVERQESPSSSGYAGERGSSSSTSVSEIEEVGEDQICEVGKDDSVDGGSDWVPGKRHLDEVSQKHVNCS
ncbi:hypothetical protein CsSME_00040740 [Camellia sinensis var. sinensis]